MTIQPKQPRFIKPTKPKIRKVCNEAYFLNSKKPINVLHLIDSINQQKGLTKEEKFYKVIDAAFKLLFEVKKESWEYDIKKVELLAERGEEISRNIRDRGMKQIIDEVLKSR